MAWIKVISETEAEGKLREMYAKLVEPWGGVDNILKIHSLNPPSLQTHYDLYKIVMRSSKDLSKIRREMIAVVVSTLNHCHYWVAHHGAGLRKLLQNDDLVERLIINFRQAEIDETERAMLEYVAKLTLKPWTIENSDIDKLRENGFSDEAILDINQVASYYAFVNRLADGLGVELEGHLSEK